VTTEGEGRRDLITVLCPVSAEQAVSVRELPTEGRKGRAVVVDRPDRHDLFLFETDGSVRMDKVEMDAEAALVRRRTAQGAVSSVALFGATGRLSVDGMRFCAAGAAELVRAGVDWIAEGNGEVVIHE
jgi:hypothetical protein